MNNGSVTPTASHFNQVRYSGKKHSGQSGPPILFAPPRAAPEQVKVVFMVATPESMPMAEVMTLNTEPG